MAKPELMDFYVILFSHYGPRHWWPAETPFEVIIGAILTQNTNWKNVEKAIDNLKSEGCLDIRKIVEIRKERLEEMIRSSGFYKQKAERLQNFCRFVLNEYGSLEEMFHENTDKIRKDMLDLKGIGHETADSILLYAGGLPFFVIDEYTRRIFRRIGFRVNENYEDIRKLFEKNIPKDVGIYKEYHALIVELAKEFCRKKPLCFDCPLRNICKNNSVV
ncbi:MAG: endonuclease III domain-containing protein [Candidatus Aenigmarchaeota archaeon]|nr:endonuclease III domain-containing protein [Candidatus Aenigmarchaeota archaeon]